MKINIYYGGRGIVDDPTLAVLEKIEKVMSELNVTTKRYILNEHKTDMPALPNTLKEADAVILATTLEWYGIGGYTQEFLDACWMYADKAHISDMYMFPLVMAKTYGEREAKNTLMTAWELLGGKPLEGLCAYVNDNIEFELNKDYNTIIENATENLYRAVAKKLLLLPTSNGVIKRTVIKEAMSLTPKETEQLSKYVANEEYVQTQKKDVEELTGLFKDLLKEQDNGGDNYYISALKNNYKKSTENMIIQLVITDKNKNIAVKILHGEIDVYMGIIDNADLTIKMNNDVFEDIVCGRKSFQRVFMSGEATSRGDFARIRKLDGLFIFS